jgi:hypothetical protein
MNFAFCYIVFECFVFIWEQTSTYSINWLVFVTEMKSDYSAVRTGSLNKAVCASSFRINSDFCDTYSINWLVFITEMKSVYSAVRTGSLNKAVCASSFRTNSDLCHLQYKLIGFYNRDEKFLQRGTDGVFK